MVEFTNKAIRVIAKAKRSNLEITNWNLDCFVARWAPRNDDSKFRTALAPAARLADIKTRR